MTPVIGIDLGTTNSCVAVPESAEIPNKSKLLADRRLRPVGRALVITDQNKSPTTPSAVWVDKLGKVMVGRAAMAMETNKAEPPALFFKRLMGNREPVRAGHATMSPEEASGHVLTHMKGIAEDVLQAPVTRAVVTVPAFFEMNAKNATTEAGEHAGLEVEETLLEPVAAALMHTHTRDLSGAMTFLVYDLGGGTFDASVVRWDPEVGFRNVAFGGDRYLGGYNFDQALVDWIVAELSKDGYQLQLDGTSPSDVFIRASLRVKAERVKKALSENLVTDLISQEEIEDQAGIPMGINLPILRSEFEHVIRPTVERTLDACDKALEKAGVEGSQLDEVVMVGGSSRVPLVAELLEKRYGMKPLLVNPDLCVAVGAALKASTLADRSEYLSIDRVPAVSSLPSLDISGRVLGGDELASAGGVHVQVGSADGTTQREEITNEEGGFVFTDIALQEEAENIFTVSVVVDGRVLDSQELVVTHDPSAIEEPIAEGDILSNDIAVLVESGLHVVAPAGTKLPHHATVDLETRNQRGELRATIFEGHVAVGYVEVKDLPRDLPIGSAVHVDVQLLRGWTVKAEARVPSAGPGALGRATIEIPVPEIPGWEDLTQRCQELHAGWHERQDVASREQLLSAGPEMDQLLGALDDLMSRKLDRPRAYHVLLRAETLLKTFKNPTVLDPPISEFEDSLRTLGQLIDRLEGIDAESAGDHRSKMKTLRSIGRAAYEAGNQLDWQTTVQTLNREIDTVESQLDGGAPAELPPAPALQSIIEDKLNEIIEAAAGANHRTGGQSQAEYEALAADANRIIESIRTVNLSDEQGASHRLMQIYGSRVLPLRARVEKWMSGLKGDGEVDLRLPSSALST